MQRNDRTRLCALAVASFLAFGAAQSTAQTLEWVEIPEGTPVQASGGTHGVEVYENPSPSFSTYPFGGTEVADDLHLTSAGNLVSFDFTLFAPITGGPTTTAVVNFYENNPADTILPSPAVLIATFAFSDLPTGVVFTKTFDLATPVALPQDVWMGVTVGQLGDFPAGLTVSDLGVLPTIGFSHDVFFAPPCSIITPPCGGVITLPFQANFVVRIEGGAPPNQPPEITCNAPLELWSPNHDLVDVSSAFTVVDPDGDPVTLTFRVFSDETETPDTGDGTGRHARDFKDELFSGGRGLLVRSERRGPEDGRFYIAVITADDGQGGVTTAVCILAVVPHDQNQPSLDDVLAQAAAAALDVQAAVDTDTLPATPDAPPGLREHGLSDPLGPKQ